MAGFILIVEDDEDLRPELVEFLRRRGRRVKGCGSLAAARETLEETLAKGAAPQHIISDVGLPDGDGLALLSEFAHRLPDTRWLLMSGSHDVERLTKTLSKLVTPHRPLVIEKPFSLQVLQRFVDDRLPED
jgi:two-component system nitrogen regulation response regulator GlnG